ncbi:MAG: penicillin-binding protein activator [Devosiaceae bacterium]|nr:penicillin-binding protein activator [Devosiaceae bacterium]
MNNTLDLTTKNPLASNLKRRGGLFGRLAFTKSKWLARWARLAFGMGVLTLASGCSNLSFPQFSNPLPPVGQTPGLMLENLPTIAGETLGTGPVRVALLLPLSGDIASVGQSMSNAAKLAMDFIEQSPNIGSNITLIIKDTAGNSAVAANKASEAISEGAQLILGPLRAESVQSAGAVARSAGVPVIGFSNNSGAASPGVYLLNVLPETEIKRSLSYAQSQGRRAFSAIVPNTEFGRIQEGAFRQAAADLGITVRAIYRFSSEIEARDTVTQIVPFLQSGTIDALFLPDRATASSFGTLIEEAGVDKNSLMIIGSLNWSGDVVIEQTPYLAGAIYPAVDDTGLAALRPAYEAQFNATPHALSTISYTAVLLANSRTLSQAQPPFNQGILISPSGFNGRDGLFRFLGNGRSEYALVIKQVIIGGSQTVDGARLP